MKNAKFKVGDRVRILDGSKISNYFDGWSSMFPSSGMGYWVDKIVTISHIVTDSENDRIGYYVKENPYKWDERGLAPACNETIVIYRINNEVIALNKITGKKAVAKCSSEDEFNFETGAKLALERLTTKFKVGDRVIGNAKASENYGVTREGWRGKIIDIKDNRINVKNEFVGPFWVDSECFDIDTIPGYYNGKVVALANINIDFTKGKIYNCEDGELIGNHKHKYPLTFKGYSSFEDLNKDFRFKFIEVIE